MKKENQHDQTQYHIQPAKTRSVLTRVGHYDQRLACQNPKDVSMTTNIRKRDVHYDVQDGYLKRIVSGGRGDDRAYCHRCTMATYEIVAHAIEETPAVGEGTVGYQIAQLERLPFSQVNVAVEFLKERGIVDVRHRRCYPSTKDVYLDAMIEFHTLAEKPEQDREK